MAHYAEGARRIVGVNLAKEQTPLEIPLLQFDPEGEARHLARLHRVRRESDAAEHARALSALRSAAQGDAELMEPVLAAVRAYATVGEICDVLREVFGVYREVAVV